MSVLRHLQNVININKRIKMFTEMSIQVISIIKTPIVSYDYKPCRRFNLLVN